MIWMSVNFVHQKHNRLDADDFYVSCIALKFAVILVLAGLYPRRCVFSVSSTLSFTSGLRK